MEDKLKGRFDERILHEAGLKTMSLDMVECRESICRIEVSWAEADVEVARAGWPNSNDLWPNAFTYLNLKTGPLAEIEVQDKPSLGDVVVPNTYATTVRQDGRYSVKATLLFGKDDIDPKGYDQFVEDMRALRVSRN